MKAIRKTDLDAFDVILEYSVEHKPGQTVLTIGFEGTTRRNRRWFIRRLVLVDRVQQRYPRLWDAFAWYRGTRFADRFPRITDCVIWFVRKFAR